ncbi:6627_t:CDS:2, partial [Racocetra fulgida]
MGHEKFYNVFEESKECTKTNIEIAIEKVKQITAKGGTHIYAILESTSVLLFSDFETSSSTADKIVKLIKDNQKKHDNQKETHDLRIFSMVMSNIVSNHLAESIARVGKRYTQYVSDLEQINRKALAMLKNSLNPPTLDYEITCTLESNEESQNNDLKVKQVPLEIPELYIGVHVKPCAKIKLNSNSQEPLIVQDPLYGSKFHPLAARKLIQEIEDGNYYLTMQMIK